MQDGVCWRLPHLEVVVATRLHVRGESKLEVVPVNLLAGELLHKGVHFYLAVKELLNPAADLVMSLIPLLVNHNFNALNQLLEDELSELASNAQRSNLIDSLDRLNFLEELAAVFKRHTFELFIKVLLECLSKATLHLLSAENSHRPRRLRVAKDILKVRVEVAELVFCVWIAESDGQTRAFVPLGHLHLLEKHFLPARC